MAFVKHTYGLRHNTVAAINQTWVKARALHLNSYLKVDLVSCLCLIHQVPEEASKACLPLKK